MIRAEKPKPYIGSFRKEGNFIPNIENMIPSIDMYISGNDKTFFKAFFRSSLEFSEL